MMPGSPCVPSYRLPHNPAPCRFLAPEVLSSKWSPKADVWAAGVMCYQLLTGRLPFNDKRNPHNPALSAVLKSILTETLDFQKSYWADVSDEAKDFVQTLLTREQGARPDAKAALAHPWLQVRNYHGLMFVVCDQCRGPDV